MTELNTAELYFLIADFLQRGTPCHRAASALREDIKQHDLLGPAYNWQGQAHPASFEELRLRYRHLSRNHLPRLLQAALHSDDVFASWHPASAENVSSAEVSVDAPVRAAQTRSLRSEEHNTYGSSILSSIQGSCRTSEAREVRHHLLKAAVKLSEASQQLRCVKAAEVRSHDHPISGAGTPSGGSMMLNERNHPHASLTLHDASSQIQNLREVQAVHNVRHEAATASRQRVSRELEGRVKNLKEEIASLLARASQLSALRTRQVHEACPTTIDMVLRQQQTGSVRLPSVARPLSCVYARLQHIKTISGHLHFGVYCVKYDKRSQYVASGADDNLVKLWSVRRGLLLRSLRGHGGVITDLAISPNNLLLATASEDRTIRIWSLLTSEPLTLLVSHTATINYLDFHPFLNILISAADDGTAQVWDLTVVQDPYKPLEPLILPAISSSIIFPHLRTDLDMPTPDHAAAPSARIAGSSASTNSGPGSLLADRQKAKVKCFSICPLGSYLATGADDGIVRIWSLWGAEKRHKSLFTEGSQAASDNQSRPGGRRVGAKRQAENAQQTREQGASLMYRVCRLEGHKKAITDVNYSHAGNRLMTGSIMEGRARVWSWAAAYTQISCLVLEPPKVEENEEEELETGRRGRVIWALDNAAWTCADRLIVTAHSIRSSSDLLESQEVWDSMSGSLMSTFPAHARPCSVLLPHPSDARIIVSAGQDGAVCVWDITSAHCLYKYTNHLEWGPCGEDHSPGDAIPLFDGAFAPNGDSFTLTDANGRIIIFGSSNPEDMSRTPNEQYFLGDHVPLRWDAHGNALDTRNETYSHLLEPGPLTDAYQVPYDNQPCIGGGGALPLSVQEMQAKASRVIQEAREWQSVLQRRVQATPPHRRRRREVEVEKIEEEEEDVEVEVDNREEDSDFELEAEEGTEASRTRKSGRLLGRGTPEDIRGLRRSQRHRAEEPVREEGGLRSGRRRQRQIREDESTDDGSLGDLVSEGSDSDDDSRPRRRGRPGGKRRRSGRRDRQQRDDSDEESCDSHYTSEEALELPTGDRALRSSQRRSTHILRGDVSRADILDIREGVIDPAAEGLPSHRDTFDPKVIATTLVSLPQAGRPSTERADGSSAGQSAAPVVESVRSVAGTPGRDNVVFMHEVGSPLRPERVDRSALKCAMCGDGHTHDRPLPGPRLGSHPVRVNDFNVWLHDDCAHWSPQTFWDQQDRWYNLAIEVKRGRQIKCAGCGRHGATVGCHRDQCRRSYHVPCAIDSRWTFTEQGSHYLCPIHRQQRKGRQGGGRCGRTKRIAARQAASKLRKYSQVLGEESGREESGSESSEEELQEETAQERKSGRWINSEWHPGSDMVLDRSWLRRADRPGRYIPQKGDRVLWYPRLQREAEAAWAKKVAQARAMLKEEAAAQEVGQDGRSPDEDHSSAASPGDTELGETGRREGEQMERGALQHDLASEGQSQAARAGMRQMPEAFDLPTSSQDCILQRSRRLEKQPSTLAPAADAEQDTNRIMWGQTTVSNAARGRDIKEAPVDPNSGQTRTACIRGQAHQQGPTARQRDLQEGHMLAKVVEGMSAEAGSGSMTAVVSDAMQETCITTTQGQNCSSRRVPSSWESIPEDWSVVLCQVGQVEYTFPRDLAACLACPAVVCRISLHIVGNVIGQCVPRAVQAHVFPQGISAVMSTEGPNSTEEGGVPASSQLTTVHECGAGYVVPEGQQLGAQQSEHSGWALEPGGTETKVVCMDLCSCDKVSFLVLSDVVQASSNYPWLVGSQVKLFAHCSVAAQPSGACGTVKAIRRFEEGRARGSWPTLQIKWEGQEADVLPAEVEPWHLIPVEAAEKPLWGAQSLTPEEADVIKAGLRRIADDKDNAQLVQAVDTQDVPDYLVHIPCPMEYALIVDRLERGYYRHLEAIEDDVRLITSNCEAYNGASSAIVTQAKRLKSSALNAVRKAKKLRDVRLRRGAPLDEAKTERAHITRAKRKANVEIPAEAVDVVDHNDPRQPISQSPSHTAAVAAEAIHGKDGDDPASQTLQVGKGKRKRIPNARYQEDALSEQSSIAEDPRPMALNRGERHTRREFQKQQQQQMAGVGMNEGRAAQPPRAAKMKAEQDRRAKQGLLTWGDDCKLPEEQQEQTWPDCPRKELVEPRAETAESEVQSQTQAALNDGDIDSETATELQNPPSASALATVSDGACHVDKTTNALLNGCCHSEGPKGPGPSRSLRSKRSRQNCYEQATFREDHQEESRCPVQPAPDSHGHSRVTQRIGQSQSLDIMLPCQGVQQAQRPSLSQKLEEHGPVSLLNGSMRKGSVVGITPISAPLIDNMEGRVEESTRGDDASGHVQPVSPTASDASTHQSPPSQHRTADAAGRRRKRTTGAAGRPRGKC